MENKGVLTSIIITEKHYTGDNHKGSSVYGQYAIIGGTNKVLISASNGIYHKTNTEIKKAHIYTSALASSIANNSDAFAMIRTNDVKDRFSEYDKELINIIKENNIAFFLDLRGGKKDQKPGIIIGDGDLEYIGYKQDFRKATEELFNSFGISVEFTKSCKAKKSVAPANKVYTSTGIPAVQFLINIDYRSPKKDLDKHLRLSAALNKYISLSMEFFSSHTYKK